MSADDLPRLEDDTLYLTPAQFARLSEVIIATEPLEGAYEAARRGMLAIGLTDAQIDSRRKAPTNIKVQHGAR